MPFSVTAWALAALLALSTVAHAEQNGDAKLAAFCSSRYAQQRFPALAPASQAHHH